MPGKTRTSSAHGPTTAKKPFKATASSSTSKPPPRFNKSRDSAAATGESHGDRKRKTPEDEPEKVEVKSSLLNAPEEIDFPRGGGSGLTQVEVREAQLEGENEAMELGLDEEEEKKRDTEVIKDKGKAKRRKLERALQSQVKEKNILPKDAFRVEHLNYKRLVPGTKVFAQIVQVRPLELIVSLPNQLLAHIPITNLSNEFTKRLEAAGEDSESESEEESDEEESDEDDEPSSKSALPGLPSLFKAGQWVSAVVVASKAADSKQKLGGREGDENVRTSRRVELSIEPEKVNEGVAKGDLKQRGFTLSCVVHDIEPDSGYTLSFGLPSLQSFISFSDAKKQSGLKRLEIGQVLLCRIKKMNDNERTCTVSIDQTELAASTLENVASITSLLPSHLVSCLITSVLPSGLNVKFFGFYDGTIDLFHLPLAPSASVEDSYKVGQKIKARIMWDAVGSSPKKFSLSAAEWVVAMEEKKIDGAKVEEKFPIGTTIDKVKVVRMDDEWGLTVEIVGGDDEEDREAGFVHISCITDDHLNTIPKNGPWKVGTTHRARVIGYSPVDGLVQFSLQPSVLEKRFLRVADAQVGEVIKATVKRLSDSAIFLDIAGNVDGVVWPMHYADIRLKHPEKKFKPGQVVKARIFSADPVRNRVVLTMKKQLITSELPIVSRIEEAQVGLVTQATVTKVNEKSVLVDFFGGLRALIPAAEAAESFSTDLTRLFTVGKVITVRLINVDRSKSRIVASVRQVDNPSTANARVQNSSAEIESIDIGTILSGTISAVHDTNIVLSLVPSNVKALISFPTLARHRSLSVEDLRLTLEKGQTIEDLVVVSKNVEKGFVIVGLVPSKKQQPSAASASSSSSISSTGITISNLSTSTVYTGKIHSKIATGLLVQISKTVRGRVALTEMGDDYEQVSKALASEFAPGRQVRCVVLSKDEENRRIDLSLRASRAAAIEGKPVEDVKDKSIEKIDDVPKVGSTVRGFVKNVANHGLFVTLGSEITARVQIKELFDEYVKDWKPRFSVGQVVEGKVLAINKVTSQVELTLRKSANVKETQSSITHADLKKGSVVSGVVRKIERYGVFVKLDGTNIQGLCHKSKVTDKEGADWKESVKEGQAVKVLIMDVNVETKKVSLGLKRSLFPEDYEGSSDGEDDSDDEDEDQEEENEDDDEEDDEMEGEGEFDSDEGDEIDLAAILKAQGGDEDDSDAEMEDDDDAPSVPVASTSKLPATKAAPLPVSTGFNWNGDEEENAESQEDDASDSEDEETVPSASASTSVAAGKKSASGLSALNDRTGDLDTQAPTSIADFERLLLGSPNSSYLWIQYIAFFVGLSQLDKAREIAKRALTTINFREEGEKLNVWVALLNLENTYGDESTLEDTFKDAAQANDAKTVHLKLIDIYERSGKFDAEEEVFKKTVKKFSQSSKVWTLFGQYYLTHGRPNEARELLPRSLKSLEKRKHVKTISKFAQLEFKLGDAERGRTIFEGIMDSYPKRLDLWFIYIDMEIKQRNVEGVRALFERVLANRLSSKKGKSVFKKWLTFEKEFGDEDGVETVKERAVEFVQSRAVGGEDDE
ncbi:Rrp5p [Sporobolomyces salmoneus]|uniref:Rrp5p n=1 Tax=Sporobolomyces salmoneus TaxID=183962 RepID=UPI0031760A59